MSRRLEWIVPFALAFVAACTGTPIDLKQDAGPGDTDQPQVCTADNECDGYNPQLAVQTVRCDGVCVYTCNGIHDECNAAPNGSARYCDAQGVCSIGCRPGSVCPNTGELCVEGVCQVGASQCATRCDCDPGQVCNGGVCQQPSNGPCETGEDCPRGPTSPVDSCNAVACNGVSDTCFELNPQPCTASADCAGRFGCTGDVSCSCNNSACVPSTTCTAATEQTACGSGNYCDSANTCQALPVCTSIADCSGFGLTCNAGTSRCERSQPCTTSAECTVAPNSFCPVGGGFCGIASCLNGGVTCGANQECSSQGQCVSPGLGSCTGNIDCAANAFCDVAAGECRLGCRSNADCPGQTCNGNQCVSTGSGAGFQETCASSSDCRSPLTCGIFTQTCAESCGTPADCVSCNAAFGACTCNNIGFCNP